MAYNTQDERLLVKGNAHVKRQLKVDGDIYQEDNKEAVLPNIISDSIALGDGVVRKIEKHSVNEILVLKNDEKNYLVPYNFDIIISIDLEKREMRVKNIVGLFD